MDADRFDTVTRALTSLGKLHPRRRTLCALLAIGLGLLAGGNRAAAGDVSAGKKNKQKASRAKERRKRDVAIEGPCGNGDGKANRCQRDGQCCTGFCQKKRCRCRRRGGTCREDRNCCPRQQGLTCQGGTCQPGPATDCDAESCPGCCAGERCLSGMSATACGSGGVACQVCPASAPICGASQTGVCGACPPRTCSAAGANCGPISDGCGGIIDCGPCSSGQTCGGGGVPNVCGVGSCTPVTCAQQGRQCGPAGDGCGGVLSCGICDDGQVCVGEACQ